MKKIHLFLGAGMVLLFLATGLWMKGHFPDAYHGDNGVRMLYRSSHLYLLHAGLLNLILGLYLTVTKGWRNGVRLAGSGLVLVGTLLLVLAFFTEPSSGVIHRPITFPAMLCLLAGVLSHVVSAFGDKQKAR